MSKPYLIRNNAAAKLIGNVKATREDWLNVAMEVLVSQGVDQVRVQPLGERLNVSRSSFYWYFKDRQQLLDALLKIWEHTNTGIIVSHVKKPAKTITEAVCNLFRCFVNPNGFDHRLDFAVREWSRRSGKVRHIVDQSDTQRLNVITDMFRRFDYENQEAITRARILYYMQLGYYAVDRPESMDERLVHLRGYLLGFTGQEPLKSELETFVAYTLDIIGRTSS